jgi:hypothetical protein
MRGNLATEDSKEQSGSNETQQCPHGMATYRTYAEGGARKPNGPKSLRQFTSTVEIRKHEFEVGLPEEIFKYCDLWSADYKTSGGFALF